MKKILQNLSPWGSYLLLVIALFYSISFNLWTNLDDPYYWYNGALHYADDYMSILSLWLGNVWRTITGDNVFTYRLLGWLMGMASILIPYCQLQDREGRLRNLFWLALGVVFMGPYTQGMYTPDSSTVLCLVILAVWILKGRTETWRNLSFLALVTAISIAVRFPNLLILPALVLFILLQGWKKGQVLQTIRKSAVYTLISILLYYIIVVLISSRLDILAFAKESIEHVTTTGGGSHGIVALLMMYWWSFLDTFWITSSVLGGYLLTRHFIKQSGFTILWVIGGILTLYLSIHHFKNSVGLFSFISILLILNLIFQKGNERKQLSFLFVALLGFIACAGSNTGLMKIYPYYAALSPFVFICYKSHITKDLFNKAVITLALFFSVSGSLNGIMQWHKNESENYAVNITAYNHYSDFNHYTGLFTEETFNRLHAQMELYEKYGCKDHTIFYGRPECHEMYALSNSNPLYFVSFYMEADETMKLDKVFDTMAADNQLVVFDYTKSEQMKKRMKEQGYRHTYEDNQLSIYTH